jgi:Family of unknown function (DUF5988)
MTSLRVVLAGGPVQRPELGSIREVSSLEEKVKVGFASGYEHFAHSGETVVIDGQPTAVYQWCEKTKIAE